MRVLILAEGKTGSTALQHGISLALDIPEKLMEPRDLSRVALPERVVVKKLIDSWNAAERLVLRQFDRRIFLVRDPRDALISRILYTAFRSEAFRDDRIVTAYLDILRKKARDPRSVSVLEVIRTYNGLRGTDVLLHQGRRLRRSILLYRWYGRWFHLYKYEDLIERRQDELQKYLGAELPEEIQVDPRYSRVKRSSTAGEWRHWFTPEDTAFFDSFYAGYFKTFGYAAEPLAPEPVIAEETSVDYVKRLVNEDRMDRNLPAYQERAARGFLGGLRFSRRR